MYPYKMEYCIVTEVLGQRGSEIPVHNTVTIHELRHATVVKKVSYWLMLTLLHLEARFRSHDISLLCLEKCKQLEMLDSSKATENINIIMDHQSKPLD